MARILIVDDDLHVRSVIRMILEKADYEVTEAANGREGLCSYREDGADLVIMDMFMPEQEGLESTMELNREFPGARILAISGGGRMDGNCSLATAVKLGAMCSLQKPISRATLLRTVKECLTEID